VVLGRLVGDLERDDLALRYRVSRDLVCCLAGVLSNASSCLRITSFCRAYYRDVIVIAGGGRVVRVRCCEVDVFRMVQVQ